MSERLPFDPGCGLDIATTTIRQLEDLATIAAYGHRVVRHPNDLHYFHEAYYDHQDRLLGIAEAPTLPCADTREELADLLDLMRGGLDEPTLSLDKQRSSPGS